MYYSLFCYCYFCYCLLYLFCFGTGKNYWANDLIFLETTREEYGMQAWLEQYMGQPSSSGAHTHTHTQTHTHTVTHTHTADPPPPEYLSSFCPLVLNYSPDRQTDRQRDRLTNRQTDRETDRHTDRQMIKLSYIHTHTIIVRSLLLVYCIENKGEEEDLKVK